MTDFQMGFLYTLIWWLLYSMYRRFMWHEIWVDKHELERLYDKENELKRLEWKDFNPVVEVKYDCIACPKRRECE